MTFFGRIWRQKCAGEAPGIHQNIKSIVFGQYEIRAYCQSGFLALNYQIGVFKFTFCAKSDDFWSNLATMRRRRVAGENEKNSKMIFKCSQYIRLTHHWVFLLLNCNWMCWNRLFLQNCVFSPILYRDLPAKWPKSNEMVSTPAAHGVGGWKLVYSIPIPSGIIPQRGVEKVFHFF